MFVLAPILVIFFTCTLFKYYCIIKSSKRNRQYRIFCSVLAFGLVYTVFFSNLVRSKKQQTWERHFHYSGLRVAHFCVSSHCVGSAGRYRWWPFLLANKKCVKIKVSYFINLIKDLILHTHYYSKTILLLAQLSTKL